MTPVMHAQNARKTKTILIICHHINESRYNITYHRRIIQFLHALRHEVN